MARPRTGAGVSAQACCAWRAARAAATTVSGSPSETCATVSARSAGLVEATVRVPGTRSPATIEAISMSDHVVLGSQAVGREALGAQRRDVGERRAAEHEVAEPLAHRRALQEAVPGEAGGIEEARDGGRLADESVVVGRHLVQAGPAAADAGLGDARR